MKTAYLVRYGAYGDHCHMSNVIKALDELGYNITFEYNYKGAQIHTYNPRVNTHKVFEPSEQLKTKKSIRDWHLRLNAYQDNYDLYVNFARSLEDGLIASEDTPEYFWPLKDRRAKNAHVCYYDRSMIWAGLTDKKYMGWTGEIYFKKEEHDHVRKQLEPYRDKFVILWALRGTMWQKAVCHIAKDICNEWLDKHPDSVIITTGDAPCKEWEWVSGHGTTIAPERGLGDGSASLIHKSGRMPFRQALNIARYVNLVVTPETGLGIGAGVLGVPKIMLLTAASLKNIVGNDKNDFSLQSDAWCSPCTRAIYNTKSCTINPETKLPICVDFDKDRVLNRMEEAYELHYMQNWDEPSDERPVYM